MEFSSVLFRSIRSITTGFPTRTRGKRSEFNGQPIAVKNFISEYIGNRNLRSRDQIQIIFFNIIHLSFFIRKLTGPHSRICIDENGRINLQTTSVHSTIKKKLNQCALQSCTFSLENRKS